MPARARIIIDTDPVSVHVLLSGRFCTGYFADITSKGVDDILAMLLAFACKSEELEVLMLSLTFGNVDVQK